MKAQRLASVAFGVSMVASVGLMVVYATGDSPQVEGVLLGLALGGLGAGLGIWGLRLLPYDEVTEEREELASSRTTLEEAVEAIQPEPGISRRGALLRLLFGAGGLLAGALAVPALSLGPRPGQSLFRTSWTRGARVVDDAGNPLRPTDLLLDSVLTVFPEGAVGSADSQTLLIRVDPARLELSEQAASWAPEGTLGYSKICTHAGCPVGLYRSEAHELLCPCHQSTFDVLRGAIPTFGPADRALPQLPMGLDEEGYLIALGDFSEPVGPGFWNMSRTAEQKRDGLGRTAEQKRDGLGRTAERKRGSGA